ncbi:hypothetical protein C8R42DRAFT_391951 [Lentinula raphanica]|nr:hypothetical protein C8R42DRAFT_391951 [Lentinula raphanica]
MVASPLQQSNVEQLSAAALLSASWVNMVLFGVELVLLPNTPVLNGDSPWVKKQAPKSTSIGSKWFILVALLNDTLCTVALCLDTYYIVRQASETSMISNNRLWPTAVWIFTTSFATTLEQTYFLYRYWTISKNRIITSMLAALILCNFFFIFVIDAGFIPTSNNMLVLQKFDAPFVSAAIITIVDISLSLVLVWKLKSVKTTRLPTQRLLRKICIFVVGYGAITAVSSALMLVMWAVNVNGTFMESFYVRRRTLIVNLGYRLSVDRLLSGTHLFTYCPVQFPLRIRLAGRSRHRSLERWFHNRPHREGQPA